MDAGLLHGEGPLAAGWDWRCVDWENKWRLLAGLNGFAMPAVLLAVFMWLLVEASLPMLPVVVLAEVVVLAIRIAFPRLLRSERITLILMRLMASVYALGVWNHAWWLRRPSYHDPCQTGSHTHNVVIQHHATHDYCAQGRARQFHEYLSKHLLFVAGTALLAYTLFPLLLFASRSYLRR